MRRFVIILGCLLAAVVIAVATLPWWVGIAVKGIGPMFGLTVGAYERNGYRQFTVRDVEYRRPGVRVAVKEATSETPLLWWWHRVQGRPGKVVAGEWLTDVQPIPGTTPSKSPSGWLPLRQQLERVADIVNFWLPEAEIGSGVVTWKGGGLDFGPAIWSKRTLIASRVQYRTMAAAAKIEMPNNQEFRIAANLSDGAGEAVFTTKGAAVEATGSWWGQRVELSSTFGPEGWLPTEAALKSQSWSVPADRAKLGSSYATLRGGAEIQWKEGNLTANVALEAEPLKGSKAPPLSIELQGHGADGLFVADALDVVLPGVTARLSEPVSIDRTGKLRSAPSRFVASCNLAEQPWFSAKGLVHLDGTISAGEAGIAKVTFNLNGRDVRAFDFGIAQLNSGGEFEWPRITIREGHFTFPDGNKATVSGGWNVKTREISDAAVRGRIGRALLAPWLPDSVAFDAVVVDATASGEWQNFAHEGRVDVTDLAVERLNPVGLRLEWRGHGFGADHFEAKATAGASALTAEGAIELTGATIAGLTLRNGEQTRLTLARPARVTWRPRLQVDQVRLEGPQTLVALNLLLGTSGRFETSIRNVQSEWFREIVKLPATMWAVDSLDGQVSWVDGPAILAMKGLGTVHLGPDRAAQLSAEIDGDGKGIKITSLRVAEGTGEIVNATGQLPVVITPDSKPWLHLDDDAQFTLHAVSSPNPGFWDKLSELAGLEIVEPALQVNLTGTWLRPKGEAQFRASRIAARRDRFKFQWPRIESLDVRITGNRQGVKLDNFSVAIEGQSVRAQGTLPVAPDKWDELMKNPRAFAREGDLHLEIPDADLGAVAQYFPDYLAAKGRLQLDLTFRADETIMGSVRVTNATSRPLGPLGVLQEVNALLVFEGRAANLQGVTAKMGGQAVTLQGRAELPKGQPARLDLTLKGDNLPFVRQTGLLLRGDLDLKLAGAGKAATISGNVKLRDSLFLSDVRSLIPSGAKGGPRRPPYFSIETPPLNAWTLNVAVNGERFLRLRTPVFNGTASARFRLSGTLGTPRIEGEAVIDEGNIRLPFANFAVQQGQVRLTPEQLEPQIWITGTTRRYGYDVRMELTGSTSAQNLTFTSSPPLEAEQVLLMVMTGQAPQNEITTTDRQRVARFGAFFGQSLLGSIGGDTTGADRLTISSGENVSQQGRETYNIEYRLDNRWSLTGEYDEYDDYYGGLKWRFYERGGRKADEKK